MKKLVSNLLVLTVLLALGITACSAESSIPSLLISLDQVPPSVSIVQPSGLIKSSSTTASFSYSDSGSGIDNATAFVYLDNVAIVGCTKTETGISCPTQGLAEGAHGLTVGVMDLAGNFSKSSGQFTVDSLAPSVGGFTPSGIITASPATVSVGFSESGSGVSASTVVVSLDGKVLQGCTPTTTSVNCPVAGIGPGEHTIRVSVADSAGYTGTGAGTFTISSPPPPPPPPASPAPGNCDPNYSGCVPRASDVDCAGGSGNGPAYVAGPVSVIGSDIYGLDRDGDGVGCE